MRNRILDLSERGARLRVRYRQLIITRDEGEEHSVPLEDVAVVIAAHPQVTFSQAVLSELAAAGGVFIACDERRIPAGMLLPLAGNSLQTSRFAAQAAASLPTRKRIWQQLVKAKIAAQSDVLSELRGGDHGLNPLIPLVRSGDPANVEARAARKYWSVLFASYPFRRDASRTDANSLLNYGYGVLRAITARALCAAGLHPSLGVHHHNQYNAFCLADDVMEPFRPLVDRAVALYVDSRGWEVELDMESRRHLLESLTQYCRVEEDACTLFQTISLAAQSLAAVFLGEANQLVLPERLHYAPA